MQPKKEPASQSETSFSHARDSEKSHSKSWYTGCSRCVTHDLSQFYLIAVSNSYEKYHWTITVLRTVHWCFTLNWKFASAAFGDEWKSNLLPSVVSWGDEMSNVGLIGKRRRAAGIWLRSLRQLTRKHLCSRGGGGWGRRGCVCVCVGCTSQRRRPIVFGFFF